ncbi:TonB-dependent receptor [Sediminitomix flava]|uniref:TonB-dependent receptor-like protein n=1 Tax=Sediminitomix flava TaxID=379075 RepID=A0A315ZEH9_SEDFL|nr:TonB-dependent receptor [Sediminitomix flava]PWJ43228.1 TonB-dependent receptor-like protein [Sediminitomix flava]
MNRFITALMLFFGICSIASAQIEGEIVSGKIVFADTQKPAVKVSILVDGYTFETDLNGQFQIPSSQVSEQSIVSVAVDHYQTVKQVLKNGMIIKLKPIHEDAGTIVLSLTELDAEDGDSQSTPGLLFSTGDAYSSLAGYAWGPYWFRQRGYQSTYTNVYFDGVNMAHPEKGYASWSTFGGLNDISRNKESVFNMAPVDFTFGNIGGSTNIITKPSLQRAGLRASYSISNSSYNNRFMLTYSSGMSDNGWAFTASASRRWAQEGYVDGTSYDAYAAYFGLEKQFSKNHSMYLTAFVAPYERGQQNPMVQEVYDLKGNNLYNTYWGYQNGEKRNSRMKSSMLPQIILNDELTIQDNLKLKTAVGYSFGKESNTALNWYDANDPRPDYYRNLPSYQYDQGNTAAGDMLTELWQSSSFGLLDWDELYRVNYGSEETNPDGDGTITGLRSRYFIEKRQNDIQNFEFNPTLIWDFGKNWQLTTGVQYEFYLGNNYNTVDDLLGADYYVDIDNFADRDFVDPSKAENDLLADTNIKTEGDRIGHDYDAVINKLNYWANISRSFNKGSYYLGGSLTTTSMYRYGNRQKGLFPENSYGKSDVLNFFDYGVKFGGEYFLNGRNVLTANATYYTQAPWLRDAFVSIRTRNQTLDNLVSSNVISADANYYYRGEDFKLRLSGFYTQINDMTKVVSYFDDSHNAFVNYALTGMGQEHKGIELGIEYQITEELKVIGAGTLASYTYISNPLATTTVDNSAEQLSDETVYFSGMHVGGTPETAFSLGLEYWSKRYWNIGFSANYLADRYVTLNPARYTERAINSIPSIDSPEVQAQKRAAILHQERLDGAFTLDVFAGKSWKVGDYFIRLNLNVNNALNNENIVTTGFQQYRFDFQEGNPEKFANRYFYAQGIRVFTNLSLSF